MTDQVIEQLQATKYYYTFKLQAKDAVNDFIDLMEETFIDLETFPKRGRPVPDELWHSEGGRMRPIKKPHRLLLALQSLNICHHPILLPGGKLVKLYYQLISRSSFTDNHISYIACR